MYNFNLQTFCSFAKRVWK